MTDLDRNIATLTLYLTRIGEADILNQINGRAVSAANETWFETTSPVDDSHIARVARGDSHDVDAAARAAKAAFPA